MNEKKEIEKLKVVFTEKWPDAARAVKRGPKALQYLEAACLWQGFREGYLIGKQEVVE